MRDAMTNDETIRRVARAEGKAEGRAEGEAKGRAEGKAEVARRMLAMNMTSTCTAIYFAKQALSPPNMRCTRWARSSKAFAYRLCGCRLVVMP